MVSLGPIRSKALIYTWQWRQIFKMQCRVIQSSGNRMKTAALCHFYKLKTQTLKNNATYFRRLHFKQDRAAALQLLELEIKGQKQMWQEKAL